MKTDNTLIDKIADKVIEAPEPYHRQPNTALYNIQLYKQKTPDKLDYSVDRAIKRITNEFDRHIITSLNLLWQRRQKDARGFVGCSFADIGEYLYQERRLTTEQTRQIKNGLLRLGGNVFYFWERGNKGKMSLINELLYKVRFDTNLTERELMEAPEKDRVGAGQLSLLKEGLGQRITGFSFRPCDVFINEIEKGGGLGYTTIKDSTLETLRKQSTIENNWFDYTARQKDKSGKLLFKTAIARFNLEDTLKKQGEPYCLKLLTEAFNSQIEKGFIKGEYQKKKEMFVWERTNKAVIKEPKVYKPEPEGFYLKKLLTVIKKNEWNISSTADKLGVSREHLSKVLKGKSKAGEELIEKIRELTG